MAYTTINKSTDYFNTKLYAGNSGTQSITGVGFQPDFLWIKRRTNAGDHNLVDVIRTSDKTLISNSTGAEYSNNTITSFDTDGFSLSGSDGAINASSNNYASWNWKANGAGSANTDGDINSTVSVNQTAGFSIVSYTGNGTSGATIGHGLNAVPKMIITKNRDKSSASQDWCVYHVSVGANKGMFLNLTNSPDTNAKYWNNTTPTSSVFTVGDNMGVNNNGDNMIAYCFAEKKGYSKFGSYTGNASADGTFVYTGFKPQFLMVKRYDASGDDWYIFDSARDTDNTVDKFLYPNASASEGTISPTLDFLSNGFKWRKASAFSPVNQSSATYIYMAFGQSLVGSNNVPCTAR